MDLIAGFKQTAARLGLAKIAALGVVAATTIGLVLWVSTLSLEPRNLLYAGRAEAHRDMVADLQVVALRRVLVHEQTALREPVEVGSGPQFDVGIRNSTTFV